MRRQIQTSAVAAMFVVVMKLDTSPEPVPALSQRSSGRFGGNTSVRLAVNTDGAEVRVAATWSHDEERLESWALVRDTD